jgi:hypothetical protein
MPVSLQFIILLAAMVRIGQTLASWPLHVLFLAFPGPMGYHAHLENQSGASLPAAGPICPFE